MRKFFPHKYVQFSIIFCSWKSKDFLEFWHSQIKIRHAVVSLSRNLLKRLPESNTFPKVPNELCDALQIVAPAVVAVFSVARHYSWCLGAVYICCSLQHQECEHCTNINLKITRLWTFQFQIKLRVGEKAHHLWGEESRKKSSAVSKSELKTDRYWEQFMKSFKRCS